jgi:hypothetical protein
MQPSDEDAQGNVLPDDEIERKRAAAAQKTPTKKTASHQINRKPKKALYLSNNRETDSVSDTMNRKK